MQRKKEKAAEKEAKEREMERQEKEKKEIEVSLQAKLKEQFVYDNFLISAVEKENIEAVKAYLSEKITELYHLRFPYQSKQW